MIGSHEVSHHLSPGMLGLILAYLADHGHSEDCPALAEACREGLILHGGPEALAEFTEQGGRMLAVLGENA